MCMYTYLSCYNDFGCSNYDGQYKVTYHIWRASRESNFCIEKNL